MAIAAAVRIGPRGGRHEPRRRRRAPTSARCWPTATARYGEAFAALLPTCKVWVNGEPADVGHAGRAGDEVAVLPPVSGG